MNTIEKRKTFDFTQGNIALPLIAFAFPMLLGNILQQTYSIFDSIVVGRFIGKEALASIGASNPITRLSIALVIGITLGVSVAVSQAIGSHKQDDVKKAISTAYIFFTEFSLVITILGFVLTPYILKAIGTPNEVLQLAITYLRITFIGTIPMVGYNVSASVFRGLGNSRVPLIMLAISTALNIILDLIFVLAFNLGVAGTAWATILSQTISFILSLIILFKNYSQYLSRDSIKVFEASSLKKILKIGVPSGLKGSMYWLGFVLITSIINSFGTETMAAFSIASKIDSFVQTPMISLSNALSTYVGQNVGAKKPQRIKQGVRVSVLIGILFSFIITLCVFVFAKNLMGIFTDNVEIIEIGAKYLKIVSALYLVYALQEVPQGVAVGCGDTLWLLLSTICAMWVVRLPLAYTLSDKFGLTGLWFSIPSGWFVALLFANSYVLSGYWKKRIK